MPAGTAVTSDAVIYLPGIMGSELVDASGKVLWGAKLGTFVRQLFLRDVFERLEPRPGDGIRASRPLVFPAMIPFISGMEPYTNLDRRLRASVVHPDAVAPYPYDWRHSIVDAAAALAPFAREHLRAWRDTFSKLPPEQTKGLPSPKLTLVCHSMGGLVASWFAANFQDEGASEVRRIITMGTPFRGSLDSLQVLATGEKLKFGLYAKELRTSARKMPGLYELLPRYGQAVNEPLGQRAITPADVANVGGSAELAEQAFGTTDQLWTDIQTLPPDLYRCMVGSAQPTLQSVSFHAGEADFAEDVADTSGARADHGGDGTVFRYAASVPGVTASPLPQNHGALAKTTEGTNYAAFAATEREIGDFQAGVDVSVRVDDLAEVGTAFAVRAEAASASPLSCTVYNADSNALVTVMAMPRVDDIATAAVTIKKPGLHRLLVGGTGLSPVERLVLVVEAP